MNSGVRQGSILGSLLFLVLIINDLSTELSSNPRLLGDETSLFLVVRGRITPANELNNDLLKIRSWVYQWEMSFNPDVRSKLKTSFFLVKLKN